MSQPGPPQNLITHKGIKSLSTETAKYCTLFIFQHSPKTSQAPWTNGLVAVQNKTLGNHLRKFFHDTAENRLLKYISLLNLILLNQFHIGIFHLNKYLFTHNRVFNCVFNFIFPEINFLNKMHNTAVIYHLILIANEYDISPFFHSTILQLASTWFPATETAMPQIYPKDY